VQYFQPFQHLLDA